VSPARAGADAGGRGAAQRTPATPAPTTPTNAPSAQARPRYRPRAPGCVVYTGGRCVGGARRAARADPACGAAQCVGGFLSKVGTPVAVAALLTLLLQVGFTPLSADGSRAHS